MAALPAGSSEVPAQVSPPGLGSPRPSPGRRDAWVQPACSLLGFEQSLPWRVHLEPQADLLHPLSASPWVQ